ncbi:hypothetical protein FB45DRAFT_536221 [Roridomyces roridus]|uniref:Uncharacterized protein n=1 Tax=Roridomyces roridus TaxID=1738132 RepID=A0AAD7FKX1_9AGAR|nr:hypothetical protein FB45DRAFT_536221 [Roridomyces roridus]
MPSFDAFKIKAFDLEPVYAAWTTGPRFLGDPKKDPPVDQWLDEIKAGCLEHGVPKEYWHTCAQHFMGEKAKARLTELKKVMAQIHGGNYRWNWKKYKVAMRNMSWDIDTSETETVKVQGFWWMPKSSKKTEEDDMVIVEEPEPMPTLSRASTILQHIPSLSRSSTIKESELVQPEPSRPVVGRAASQFLWPLRKDSKGSVKEATLDTTVARPSPRKAKSDGELVLSSEAVKPLPPLPEGTIRAPAWLLNAANAMDFLSSEHPRVMSTLSAILVVAGTIPALPGISAGAGGAILASSTAHAIGAVAIGLGNWIRTQQEMHTK